MALFATDLQHALFASAPIRSGTFTFGSCDFETLIFGCIRQWCLHYFPEVLVHLIVHYFDTTLTWSIPPPSRPLDVGGHVFESPPFTVNGITFRSYLRHKVQEIKSILEEPKKDPECTYYLDLWTKVVSMPNTIRVCTVFCKFSLLDRSHVFRHNFTFSGSTKAQFPYSRNAGDGNVYPLNVKLAMEPIRIHHWSYDNVVDYQQDIRMKEYVEYKWTTKPKQHITQSPIFGNCWCLELKGPRVSLKLLKLPPNITRIMVECGMETMNWKQGKVKMDIGDYEPLEFGFSSDLVQKLLTDSDTMKGQSNADYAETEETVFVIQIRILEVYAISKGKTDAMPTDMSCGDDVKVPIGTWRDMGIV